MTETRSATIRPRPARFRGATLALALLLLGTAAWACPFCSPDARMPGVQRQLRDHVVVALATCRVPPPIGNSFERVPAQFELTRVLKGEGIADGARVTIEMYGMLTVGDRVLLLSKTPDLTQAGVRRMSDARAEWFEAVVALPEATGENRAVALERLRFFLPHLGDPDRLIAATVIEEFSKAPYELVCELRDSLDGARLAELIESPKTPSAQRGLLFLLYSTIDDETVPGRLQAWLHSAQQRQKPGLDGLLGGYLLVRGQRGLAEVLDLADDEDGRRPVSERRWYAQSLIAALDFHARFDDVLERSQIVDALHRLLQDRLAASAAIGELRRLEDWDSLEAVLKARAEWGDEHPPIEREALSFLRACPRVEPR